MELDYIFEIDDWFDEFDIEDSLEMIQLPKKYIRDVTNPIETLNDVQFQERYRFRKSTVLNVLVPICAKDNINNRGLPVPVLIEVLTALRFYATSSFQIVCGDLVGISQPTVHRIIKELSEKFSRQIAKFIKMPSSDVEIRRTWRDFYEKAGFPGVIGLIDGTHIPIKSPGGSNAEIFRSRKGYFTINVQIVCGPNYEIFDIVNRWPGSAHDSRIFDSSNVRVFMENNFRRIGHLLGDSGYGQKAYIFTPLLNPVTGPEIRYNMAHKTTRSLVERTIGRLKRRFPCLYFELQTKIKNTLRIITACAVLHNIGIQEDDPWDNDDTLDIDVGGIPLPVGNSNISNNRIRNDFIIRHFS